MIVQDVSALNTRTSELASVLNKLTNTDAVPEEVIAFIEANVDREVVVYLCNGTYYKGVVHSCNKAQSGEYPGVREPVYVKITGSVPPGLDQAIGMVFEYSLDRITFI